MAPAVPSSFLSDSSGSSEVSQVDKLPWLADFAMVTLLLHLIDILKDVDGSDGFTEDSVGLPQGSHVDTEADFTTLNAMGAILGQRNKVVVAKCIKLDSDSFIAMPDPDDAQCTAAGTGIAEIHALMSNPRSCQRLGDKLQSIVCFNIKPDDWHWREIQQDPLYHMSAGMAGLERHGSIVCAYFNDCRRNPLQKSKYSRKFSIYLLSVCWPEIYRRLASWRGLGFIYKLSRSLSKFKLERNGVWKNVQYDTTKETRLVKFISAYPNIIDGLKYAAISRPKGASSDWQPPAKDLLHFETLMTVVKGGKSQLYSKDTADDFHRLIFASLVTFGRSLRRFGRGISLEKQGRLSLESLCDNLYALRAQAELLFHIFTSSTFRRHIEVLRDADELGIQDWKPEFSERENYRAFGKRMSIWDYELITRITGGDMTRADNARAEDTCADSFELEAPPEDLTMEAFVEWVKTLLHQFIAKGMLEDQCLCRPDIPIEIPLLAVNFVTYRVPSWEKAKKIMTDALSNAAHPLLSADIHHVLARLEQKIKGFQIPCNAEVKKTVDIFRGIIAGREVGITVSPHCEAVLATLVKFLPSNGLADEDGPLSQLCARLHESKVLLPKRCCAVCSELLSILMESEQGGAVFVPECRSTIYPTILPAWLPERIHRDMFLKFQGYLRKELCYLINLPQTKSAKHNRRHGMQSGAIGFTVGKSRAASDSEIRNIPSQFYSMLD